MVMQNGGIIFNVSHSRAAAKIIRMGRASVCVCACLPEHVSVYMGNRWGNGHQVVHLIKSPHLTFNPPLAHDGWQPWQIKFDLKHFISLLDISVTCDVERAINTGYDARH